MDVFTPSSKRLKDAKEEGAIAYCRCIRINPYDQATQPALHEAWFAGWLEEIRSRQNWPPLLKAQEHGEDAD